MSSRMMSNHSWWSNDHASRFLTHFWLFIHFWLLNHSLTFVIDFWLSQSLLTFSFTIGTSFTSDISFTSDSSIHFWLSLLISSLKICLSSSQMTTSCYDDTQHKNVSSLRLHQTLRQEDSRQIHCDEKRYQSRVSFQHETRWASREMKEQRSNWVAECLIWA